MPETATPAPADAPPSLEITASRQFTPWLREQEISLAFTTYQTGKLFFIGLDPKGKMSVFERTFERCMGLATDGSHTLWMANLYQLWRFQNALPEGSAVEQGYDALYVPKMSYVTGDLDIHDVAIRPDGSPVFVNSLFSCLAEPSADHSFRPIWKPPFISKYAAEDRCHLNGLALDEKGEPKYVTMVSETDVHEGWREHRVSGGVVMDVQTDKVICSGLSMPHSPRVYREKLYLINSGSGEFGEVVKGEFKPIAFLPGYARGLTFVGDFAVIGLSECRDNRTFQDLPLNDKLKEKGIEPRCGLQVVDLRTGDVVHSLNCKGVVKELYDVVALPGVRQPSALGFKTDEIRRTITIDEA